MSLGVATVDVEAHVQGRLSGRQRVAFALTAAATFDVGAHQTGGFYRHCSAASAPTGAELALLFKHVQVKEARSWFDGRIPLKFALEAAAAFHAPGAQMAAENRKHLAIGAPAEAALTLVVQDGQAAKNGAGDNWLLVEGARFFAAQAAAAFYPSIAQRSGAFNNDRAAVAAAGAETIRALLD